MIAGPSCWHAADCYGLKIISEPAANQLARCSFIQIFTRRQRERAVERETEVSGTGVKKKVVQETPNWSCWWKFRFVMRWWLLKKNNLKSSCSQYFHPTASGQRPQWEARLSGRSLGGQGSSDLPPHQLQAAGSRHAGCPFYPRRESRADNARIRALNLELMLKRSLLTSSSLDLDDSEMLWIINPSNISAIFIYFLKTFWMFSLLLAVWTLSQSITFFFFFSSSSDCYKFSSGLWSYLTHVILLPLKTSACH